MTDPAQRLIEALGLEPLPDEGGYYRETYRASDKIGDRSLATAIYYVLTPDTVSALHRLPADEVFHFYAGDPVMQLTLNPDGEGRLTRLGPDVLGGDQPQAVVPAGVWQGAFLVDGGAYALLGTTMAPGFEFSDYEGGDRVALTAGYPAFEKEITRLTPQSP